MEKFAAVFKKVQKINKAIIGAVLLLMIGVVFLQTFCRFVIFKSLTWSEELSRYLFVALIVLGINLAATDHLFVRIELIDGYLKGKAQYVMDVIRKGIAIYVSLILMYSGYGLIEIGGYQISPAMGIPMSLLYVYRIYYEFPRIDRRYLGGIWKREGGRLMQTAAIALIVVLLVGMACGLEITWALGLSCIAAVLLDPKLTFVVIAQRIFANSNSFSMLAIPAFMLAGDVMSKGGLSKRLVAFADSLVGWISGGISLVSIVACTFFAAISGSSVATTAAIGGLMYPEMVKRGYPESYAAAVQAIGGTLGIVIPPSIVLVIYGNITGTDVGALLMAGILPGVVCSIFLCLYAYYKAKKCGFPKSDKFSFKRFLVSFKDAVWALIMPVIILGGIYAGIFTPTESAVVAVVYGLIVCLAVYREISMKTIWEIVENTAEGTANLMILVVTAQMFGWLISYYQIPQAVTNFMLAFVSNKYMFWAIIIILLTICGMFLEVGATNLILGPILAPIAAAFGIDPVQFGLVFVFLLAMGQATPPFGTCMFVACGISKQSVGQVSKHLVPFVVVEILCGILFALVPGISLLLPSIIG